MEDYKIIPDEKEMRVEKRRKEMEEFKARLELERAERDLLRMTRVGLCMAKSTIDLIEGELWYDSKAVFSDKRIAEALKDFVHATSKLQEALDASEVQESLPDGQTTLDGEICKDGKRAKRGWDEGPR